MHFSILFICSYDKTNRQEGIWNNFYQNCILTQSCDAASILNPRHVCSYSSGCKGLRLHTIFVPKQLLLWMELEYYQFTAVHLVFRGI